MRGMDTTRLLATVLGLLAMSDFFDLFVVAVLIFFIAGLLYLLAP
jgi:hypothetical protein